MFRDGTDEADRLRLPANCDCFRRKGCRLALVCIPALDDPAAVERDHHAARQLTRTSLHALASRAASRQRLRGALRAAAGCASTRTMAAARTTRVPSQQHRTNQIDEPVLHRRQAGGRR